MKNSILLFILIFTIFGCSKYSENSNLDQNTLRADFLKGKTSEQVTQTYLKLPAKEKKALWNEKLTQILAITKNKDLKNIVLSLKLELKKEHLDMQVIRKYAMLIADISTQNEFESMFLTLEDYKLRDDSKQPVSMDIKEQLKNSSMNFNEPSLSNQNTQVSYKKYPIDCSCNWTCSSMCTKTTSKCNITSSGCGFLYAFNCEYACAL